MEIQSENIFISITNNTPQTTRVLLEGDLIIRNAKYIKKELITALNSSPNVELIFRNIERIDLSVIQLLIALQKSSVNLENKVSFDFELSEELQSLIENSGLRITC